MELGDLLKRRALDQEERSNDEDGEIGDQVAACMDIVAEAVMSSDMDVLEKIKWEDALHAGDNFCMLDGMEVSYRTSLKANRKTWGIIADDLMKRASAKDDADWKSRADRTRLCEALERVVDALDDLRKLMPREDGEYNLYKDMHIEALLERSHRLLQDADALSRQYEEMSL